MRNILHALLIRKQWHKRFLEDYMIVIKVLFPLIRVYNQFQFFSLFIYYFFKLKVKTNKTSFFVQNKCFYGHYSILCLITETTDISKIKIKFNYGFKIIIF